MTATAVPLGIPCFTSGTDESRRIQALRGRQVTFRHPSRMPAYAFQANGCLMNSRMPRPEDVSRDHIDAAVIGFLKAEKDADWTEVSLVTLHPREEIRLVLKENRDRYRTVNERRFLQLLARLEPQGMSLPVGY